MQQRDANGFPRMISYLKHFTAYSRETDRGHDSYEISAYDFADTYLPQFKKGMMEGNASGVMCSYNGENGFPSCANGWLLRTILRERWNRPHAVVVTDSGAVKNLMGPPVNAVSECAAASMAINNGSDMNDGPEFQYLPQAVAQGLTDETKVDEALKRNMRQLFQVGLFDPPSSVEWTSIPASVINSTEHQRINAEAAEQAVVLLRNDDDVLPLDPNDDRQKIAVVGPQALTKQGLLSDYATEQACVPTPTQSDTFYCITSIAEAVAAIAPNRTFAAAGVDVNSNDDSRIAEAVSVARGADVVLLCLGIDRSIEGEGQDRVDITLPGLQPMFAKAILALNKPTVLILTNGGSLSTEEFDSIGGVSGHGASAIVEAFNPNVVGAQALARLLFGVINTFGKLPYSVYPSSYTTAIEMESFDMTKSPGRTYRYYQGPVNYEFGFGLSYTTFNLTCHLSTRVVRPPRRTSRVQKLATCVVQNTGKMDGDEVVMMFVRPSAEVRASADHVLPLKRLVGFDRVRLRRGEKKSIEFSYDETTFASTTNDGGSTLYAGEYELIFWRGNGDERVFNVTVPEAR